MKKIIIFGSGDHAKVILGEIIKKKKFKVIGFYDENKKKNEVIIKLNGKVYKNIIGKIDILSSYLHGIIGVGDNNLRKKIQQRINKINNNFKWSTVISNNSIIDKSVKLGVGTFISANCFININSSIGDHCIINSSSSLDHDNIIKNFVSIAPGTICGGNVQINDNTQIGIGTIIRNNVKIGKNILVGGGSYVNKDLIDNSVYYGIPIKKILKKKVK